MCGRGMGIVQAEADAIHRCGVRMTRLIAEKYFPEPDIVSVDR